jgi:hypothetical protein
MITSFLTAFSRLPPSNKSMIYLMWIFKAWSIIGSVFVSIFVFKLHSSIIDLIIYNAIIYMGLVIGFTGFGWMMSIFQRDIRQMYYLSYVLFIASYLFLFIAHESIISISIFGFIFGIWVGTFWNGVHTQELHNIADKDRDFYSSSISAGDNILTVVIPFLVAILFYVADIFWFDGYVVLFAILPGIYLLSFLFISNIVSYIPKRIDQTDVSNFSDIARYGWWHLYFIIGGMLAGFKIVIIPVVTILMLRNEMNIG